MNGIETGAAFLASKDLLNKLLGPTADYFGGKLKDYAQKATENVERMLDVAIKKLGDRLNDDGRIPIRVAREAIDGAAFAEDELFAEYFGGILASSRTVSGVDDTNVYLLGIIRRLSVHQLRFHYLAYRAIHHSYVDPDVNLGDGNEARKYSAFVPQQTVLHTLFGSEGLNEIEKAARLHMAIGALVQNGLIHPSSAWGDETTLETVGYKASGNGLCVGPTFLGAQLFVSIAGMKVPHANLLLDSDLAVQEDIIPSLDGIQPATGCKTSN